MNNALTAIIIAIGGTSLVCLLVSRMQGRRSHLRRSRDSAGSDGGYYGPGYGYYGGPAYVAAPGPGGCYWQRQRFWDGYAWRIRRVQVCG